MTESKQLEAMRATVKQDGGVSEARLLEFIKSQPGLEGRDIRITLETSDVRAGVSAGHLFFRLDDLEDVNAGHCGRYVLRFDIGPHRLFRGTSLKDQFDVMRTLRGRGLAVPDAVWLAPTNSVADGTPALIMRRVNAQSPEMLYMQKGPFVEASSSERQAILERCMRFCVDLHSEPVEALGLDFLSERGGNEGHFIDRQINWMQDEFHSRFSPAEDGERAPLFSQMRRTCDEAAEWLRARAPRHRKPVLVHGDVTLANIMFNDDGSVAAVLDWELCHEGLPEEDVAWFTLAAYGSANAYGASVEAIPSREDVCAAYLSAGGVVDDLEFGAALSAFTILSITALAMRVMPPQFWSEQPESWVRQEALLFEAMERFEGR